MQQDRRSGLIYILLSTLGFSTFPIFTKFIYLWSDLQPLDLAIWRFTFAIPFIWVLASAWTLAGNGPQLPERLPRLPLLLTGLLYAGAALTALFGLPHIDASIYVVLFFTYPAMTSVLAMLTGEKLPMRGWVALAMTTVGIVLTAPEIFSGALEGSSLFGVWIALLNALFVAVYLLVMGRVTQGYPATVWSTVWSITGTTFVMIPAFFVAGVASPETVRVWLLFVGMGLFSTVIPIFGMTMGVRKLGASRAAIVGTLEPALVIVMAAFLLGERMRPIQLVGATLIVASIVILEAKFKPKQQRSGANLPENA